MLLLPWFVFKKLKPLPEIKLPFKRFTNNLFNRLGLLLKKLYFLTELLCCFKRAHVQRAFFKRACPFFSCKNDNTPELTPLKPRAVKLCKKKLVSIFFL